MKKVSVKQLFVLGIKLRFLLFILSIQQASYSQDLSVGLKTIRFYNQSLNNMVDQYNDTRPWLNNKLGKHNFVSGITGKVEFEILDSERFFWIFSMSYLRNQSKAKGTTPSGEDFTRYLKSRVFEIGLIGASYYPISNENLKLGIGVNLFTASWYNILSKINTNDEGWVNYTEPVNLSKGASSVFSKNWFSSSLEINAKYNVKDKFWLTLSLHTQKHYVNPDLDILDLAIALNPTTHNAKLFDKRAILDHWGVSLYFSKNNF